MPEFVLSDKIRNAIRFERDIAGPTLRWDRLYNPKGEFKFVPNSMDCVLLEMQLLLKCALNSQSVSMLREKIERELGA
jgi:hypothetical protein